MPTKQEILNKLDASDVSIRTAIKGKDVRQALHDDNRAAYDAVSLLENEMNYKGTLNRSSTDGDAHTAKNDLNKVIEMGVYYCEGTSSRSPYNSPTTLLGVLLVAARDDSKIAIQTFFSYDRTVYTRFYNGYQEEPNQWSAWTSFSDVFNELFSATLNTDLITMWRRTLVRHSLDEISSSTNDLNFVGDTGIYYLYGQSGGYYNPYHSPANTENPGMLLVVARNDNAYLSQTFYETNGKVYFRYCGAFNYPNERWTDWKEVAYKDEVAPLTTPFTAKMFMRVGCIGDSYMAGYIKQGNDTAVDYNRYSWVTHMSNLTGREWTNFGVSGSSTKSWMQGRAKLDSVLAEGNKCQAYCIGLALNDSGTGGNHVDVVSESNIDLSPYDPESEEEEVEDYYYYYSRLIMAVNYVNPTAPIICFTVPKTYTPSGSEIEQYQPYNIAVRNIVRACQTAELPVFLCDLRSRYFDELYFKHPTLLEDQMNGHFSAIGYEFIAECLLRCISDTINSNLSAFQGIHKVPFDMPSNYISYGNLLDPNEMIAKSIALVDRHLFSFSDLCEDSYIVNDGVGYNVKSSANFYRTKYPIAIKPNTHYYLTGIMGRTTTTDDPPVTLENNSVFFIYNRDFRLIKTVAQNNSRILYTPDDAAYLMVDIRNTFPVSPVNELFEVKTDLVSFDCKNAQFTTRDNYIYLDGYYIKADGTLDTNASWGVILVPIKDQEKLYFIKTGLLRQFCVYSESYYSIIEPTEIPIDGRLYDIPKTLYDSNEQNPQKTLFAAIAVYSSSGSNVFKDKQYGAFLRGQSKKIAAIGDSITWLDNQLHYGYNGGGYDSGYDGRFTGWQAVLRKAGYEVHSYGYSGIPYGDYRDPNDHYDKNGITNRVISGKSKASLDSTDVPYIADFSVYDTFILFGGANDMLLWEDPLDSTKRITTPFGDDSGDYTHPNVDTSTFNGAIGKLIQHIRVNAPNAKIYLCTTLQCTSDNRPFEINEIYKDAIIQNGDFWAAKVIDLFRTMNVTPLTNSYSQYFYDVVHPNEKGMLRIGNLILEAIEHD